MSSIERHVVLDITTVREALIKLDVLASDAILFVVNRKNELLGSLTDGDLRRGFIKGLGFEDDLLEFVQPNPSFVTEGELMIDKLEQFKAKNFRIVPVLNQAQQIVGIINFREQSTVIPADAVLMAGGKGLRLRPLTNNTPKPLLRVGGKPIVEYNLERLKHVGIKNVTLSVNYLGNQIIEYFNDGSSRGLNIQYVQETKPMGTIGSVLLIDKFKYDDILVMNSDLLTNIDFKDFYKVFKDSGADMAVAATTYKVDVPYAVLEVNGKSEVLSLKEKPKYTYHSNAGIYFLKKDILKIIPRNQFYDITDLVQRMLEMNLRVTTYEINGYWLDIGQHEDYKKAQEDIKHIKF